MRNDRSVDISRVPMQRARVAGHTVSHQVPGKAHTLDAFAGRREKKKDWRRTDRTEFRRSIVTRMEMPKREANLDADVCISGQKISEAYGPRVYERRVEHIVRR